MWFISGYRTKNVHSKVTWHCQLISKTEEDGFSDSHLATLH